MEETSETAVELEGGRLHGKLSSSPMTTPELPEADDVAETGPLKTGPEAGPKQGDGPRSTRHR